MYEYTEPKVKTLTCFRDQMSCDKATVEDDSIKTTGVVDQEV